MHKIDEIMRLMKGGKRGAGWDDDLLRHAVTACYKHSQVIEFTDSFGGIKAAIGWFYLDDEEKEKIPKKEFFVLSNSGRHVFPMFAVNKKLGIAFIKGIARRLQRLAQLRGGKLVSFRHGRIMEV